MLRMRLSNKVVVCLIMIVVSAYYFMLTDHSNGTSPAVQLATSTTNGIISTHGLVDAVVYISMGEGMSQSGIVDYSVASLRVIGRWNGDVYIITDAPDCFTDLVNKHQVKTVPTNSLKDILHIKALKSKILTLLPDNVSSILYIDVDIIVSRSLDIFLRDLRKMSITMVEKSLRKEEEAAATPSLRTALSSSLRSAVSSSSSTASSVATLPKKYELSEVDVDFDFAAFPDAGGHYVGFCSGCEKWHTGVLWLKRGKGERCLAAWRDILLSGRFDTDQESIDAAEAGGSCLHALMLPSKHLLFAKDYVGMALTSGQTFIHATAAARLDTQDDFYKTFVLPRLHASLDPPLNPSILEMTKTCRVRVQTPMPTRAPTSPLPEPGSRSNRKNGFWW